MKILVTGSKGQLGFDVLREGISRGHDMIGYDIDTLDITNELAVKESIAALSPDAVIHCAAYTAVDKAESERELCNDVNVNGTKYIAEATRQCGAKLVYISTDYVFDGKGDTPHAVTEKRHPINYYGVSKSYGEDLCLAATERHFIVRTSWVFGVNGKNFVKTMLRLGKEKEELTVVADQIGSPTYTPDLSKLLLDMVVTEEYGVYHAANSGFCSWYEFAVAIMEKAGLSCKVKPVLTKDYPSAAKRPQNSRLDTQCLKDHGFSFLPSWEDALERFLQEQKNGSGEIF